MSSTKPTVGFIGAGKVGNALSIALGAAGYPVVAVASRSFASAQALAARIPGCTAYESPQSVVDAADLVFITTPDDAMAETADALNWHEGKAALHTSGSASREVLASALAQGAQTGSLHPLQAFADPELAAKALPGSVFGVEAEGNLKDTLLQIVADLGGTPIELSAEDKALYHGSAAYAASYVVTLLKLATDVWTRFGWAPADALRALLPLLRGTLHNLEEVGIPGALTGPIGRGDVSTVRRNLAAIDELMPEQAELYRALSREVVKIGLAKGTLSGSAAAELRDLLAPGASSLEGAKRA
jgi:predicted short-subunit dehydrogenase-like oxidoreductase (DUF2520 family)